MAKHLVTVTDPNDGEVSEFLTEDTTYQRIRNICYMLAGLWVPVIILVFGLSDTVVNLWVAAITGTVPMVGVFVAWVWSRRGKVTLSK